MWRASKFGFYSIVCKGEEQFHVRARVRGDLENLLGATELEEEIHESDRSDYKYRLVVGHDAVRKITSALAETLDDVVNIIQTSESRTRHVSVQSALREKFVVSMDTRCLCRKAHSCESQKLLLLSKMQAIALDVKLSIESVQRKIF